MHTRRIITGLGFIPIFLVGILWEYGDWFTAAVVSLCFFAIREEMYSLMGIKRDNTLMLWQNVLAVLFFIFTVTHNVYLLITFSFLFYWGSCLLSIRKSIANARIENATHSLLVVYILFPLACFAYLRSIDNGPTYLFFMLGVACFTDIGAYYGGKAFGKHRLAPIISPNKTWEGSFCGIFLTALVVILTAWIQSTYWSQTLWLREPFRYGEIFIVTVLLSIVGQVGDLSESAMKRDAGIKDSGSKLTGHGGFLDMMDSMLWIGPSMFVYVFVRFYLLG